MNVVGCFSIMNKMYVFLLPKLWYLAAMVGCIAAREATAAASLQLEPPQEPSVSDI